MVAITGQVAQRRRSARTPSRRRTSRASRCRSPSTTSWCRRAEDIPRVLAEAFHLAAHRPARPGAGRHPQGRAAGADHVHLAAHAGPARLPADAAPARQADPRGGPADRRRPGGRCSTSAAACSRPAPPTALRKLAELTGIPVVTTLMARGAFPDSHPQHLGMPGMHGTVAAVYALQKADLLVALGARFDDRVTGKLDTFAPGRGDHARRHRPGRDRQEPARGRADRGRRPARDRRADRRGRRPSTRPATGPTSPTGGRQLDDLRDRYPLGWDEPPDGTLAPQYVIKRLGEIVGPDAIYVAGVGQHQMWASQFISYEKPGTWLNSGGARHDGLRGAGGDGRQGRQARTRWCGRSTATAASR